MHQDYRRNSDIKFRYLPFFKRMVHPGGFEPPTARFVAEYSIQLSYGCIGKLALLRVSVTTNTCHTEYDGLIGRVTRLCLALRAVAKATAPAS